MKRNRDKLEPRTPKFKFGVDKTQKQQGLIDYRFQKPKLINLSKQELNTLNDEKRRLLQLLRNINRNFNQHAKGKFDENIQFSDNNENTTFNSGIDNTLGKAFTRKENRVHPYHDLESRFEFDKKLIHQYHVNQSTNELRNKEFENRKVARRQKELPILLKESHLTFISKQEQLLTDYFNGTLREDNILHHVSPLEHHARDIIKRILNHLHPQVFTSFL